MFSIAAAVQRTLGAGRSPPATKRVKGPPVYTQYGPGLKYVRAKGAYQAPTYYTYPLHTLVAEGLNEVVSERGGV